MKVLVLGVLGMAGHVIATSLQENGHQVLGFARKPSPCCETITGDALDPLEIEHAVKLAPFDVVVNCIGVLNHAVDSDSAPGIYLNSVLPHLLEKYTARTSTRVIHLSTDCVFSGAFGGYLEDSIRDADSMYGRSKALGELYNEKDITIRTSIVGPDLRSDGAGLFNWFMRKEDKTEGYSGAIWTGVTTVELAKAIPELLKQRTAGLYHLVPDEVISKYRLLELFNGLRECPVELYAADLVHVDKSLRNTRRDVVYEVPTYSDMVLEMGHWIQAHAEWYPHYHLRRMGL